MVLDCLVMGQLIVSGTDERVILFVKLLEGESLTEELVKRIKHEIRSRRSPRHVPAQVCLPVLFSRFLLDVYLYVYCLL